MKNTQTSKNAKHQHAVVICPIIGMRNVKFKIGDKVWFVPDQDGCTEPKFGEVIGITANILKGKGRGDVSYTILDDDENQYVVNHDHVHAHRWRADGLIEVTCKVYCTPSAYQYEKIFAKNIDEAIAGLKQKYPNAYDIQHAWYNEFCD